MTLFNCFSILYNCLFIYILFSWISQRLLTVYRTLDYLQNLNGMELAARLSPGASPIVINYLLEFNSAWKL